MTDDTTTIELDLENVPDGIGLSDEDAAETILAGLSALQMQAAQFGSNEVIGDAGVMTAVLIESNPDLLRKTIIRGVGRGYLKLSLPVEHAETLGMDPDEWPIFHDEGGPVGTDADDDDTDMSNGTQIDIE